MSCFRAASSLAVIVGCIINKIYAVRTGNLGKLTKYLGKFEACLEKWHLALPEYLRYSTSSDKLVPPPHVLCIHIQYWCTVLLLHRKFIPNPWPGHSDPNNGLQYGDGKQSLKSLEVCHGAVKNITSIITAHSVNFAMRSVTAFLPAYLFSAGVMYSVTLSVRPYDVQAQAGLQQTLSALKDMEIVWPSATKPWELLNGARMKLVDSLTPLIRSPNRIKRSAENAFGGEDQQECGQEDLTRTFAVTQAPWTHQDPAQRQVSNSLMAHMLGLKMQSGMSSNSTHDSRSKAQVACSPRSPTFVSESMSGSLPPPPTTISISQNFPIMNETLSSDFAQTTSSSSATSASHYPPTSTATHYAATSTEATPRYDQLLAEADVLNFIFEEYVDDGRGYQEWTSI